MTDKKDKALKQALEALNELKAVMPIFPKDGDCIIGYKDRYNAAQYQASNAIAAAKQALEQTAKPWVELTENTILNLMPESIPAEHDSALLSFAHAVIEAYKEKNT